ncbi:MAG: 2-dehydropantoate 2-reductase [Burkholderiales bacterium]|nr:2-dehydropantoate 2-reductase [Burkholderiales bacterium]
MKTLVLGAGGVGGYFGARLAQAGSDVTFLVRPRRAANLIEHGVRVQSPHGDFTIQPQLRQAGESLEGFDLVILTCKAYDLDSAMDSIAPAMDRGCAVLPLLNGIAHLERLDARFGRDNVLGGTCHIAATLTADGVVKQLHDVHRIMYGERDRRITPRIEALDAAFRKTPVEAKLSPDIELEMWEKVAFLSTLAGMTCLMRGSVGAIAATPDGAALLTRYLAACCAVAEANGHKPRDAFVERMSKTLTDPSSTLTASMLRDLQGGGPVEADHIVGFMLGKARAAGIEDTLLAMAYTHLKVYEAQRS